jgi:hypothetical protein
VIPEGFDPQRWVVVRRLQHAPVRCFLGGNPHTQYGLMHSWCEELGEFRTINKDDVIEASPVAHAWIDGFLVGSEPDLHEYLGLSVNAADHIDGYQEAINRWQADLAEARKNGWMQHLFLRPSAPVPSEVEHLEPWCWIGGEFLAWRDGRWGVVDPPPSMSGGFLERSMCHARGQHEMEVFGTYIICVDCGDCCEVELSEPDDAAPAD